MKKIAPIKIGNLEVRFDVWRPETLSGNPHSIVIVATCGTERREMSLTFHPKHDKNPAEFQENVDHAAILLARETIGHLKAKLALDDLIGTQE